jgi:hypothetical protein
MQSFEEFGKYILENSSHNTRDSKQVHIILDYPKIEWDDYAQYMATLTWYSGIGKGKQRSCGPLIFAKDLDEAVQHVEKYDYAMVSYIGTFYYHWEMSRPETIHTYFDEFCESDKACRGHILWHEKNAYARLHQQCMFLNLNHWRKIGRPSFGKYSGPVIWPERSKSNVHDDYTPHWLRPPEDPQIKQVRSAEMAEYISKVIEDGQTIYNFDRERNTKFFCYPERRHCEALDIERNKNANIVYTKNNEKYNNMIYKTNMKFDVIYAPASGFTAELLYHHYGHEDTEVVLFDVNKDSLNWKRMVYEFRDLDAVERYYQRKEGVIVDNADYKPVVVEENEKIFPTDMIEETIEKIGNPKFILYDAITDPISKLEIDTDKVNLLYFSNIFCYHYMIHRHTIEKIHERWNEYLDIDNCIVAGKNAFREEVLHGSY